MATGNFTKGDVFVAVNDHAVGRVAAGAVGDVLTSNGAGELPTYETPTGGPGGGAPTDVEYLVKTADTGLSAERVVTDTTSLVWDWTTASQAKASVQFGTGAGVACEGNDGRLSDARTPLTHSHAPSDVTGTAVVTNDSRLSDARTPTAHSHAQSDITNLATTLSGKSDTSHNHAGVYDPAGSAAAAQAASQPVDATLTAMAGVTTLADRIIYFTDVDVAAAAALTLAGRNVIGAADAPAQRTALGLGGAATLSVGTIAGTVCAGDDSRLSDARTPTAHTHGLADITDEGSMAAVNDAPSDGSTYGRKDGAWAVAGGGSGLTHPQVMARAVFAGVF